MPSIYEKYPALVPDFFALHKGAIGFVRWLLQIFAIPFYIVLRRNFGERYLPAGSFVLGMFVFHYATLASVAKGDRPALVLQAFFWIVLVMGIGHLATIYRRNRKGVRLHSYHDGDPLPMLTKIPFLPPGAVTRFCEPFLVILIGILAGGVFNDPIFTGWMYMGAFSLFMKATIEQDIWRHRILDAIDGQIEAQQMTAALVDQKPPRRTEGFRVWGVPSSFSREQREGLARAFGGLDPELREMVSEEPSPPAPVEKSAPPPPDPEPDPLASAPAKPKKKATRKKAAKKKKTPNA